MPRDAVDPAQREIGEHAAIEVDHGELFGAIEFGGIAHETEAVIVDHDRRLETFLRERSRDVCRPVRAGEVGDNYTGAGMTGAGDFVGKCCELRLPPRRHHHLMAVRGEHARQRSANADGSAGDQAHGLHR